MPQPEGHRRHAPLHGFLIQPSRHILTQRVVGRVHPHPKRLVLSNFLDQREQIDPQSHGRRHRAGPSQQQIDIACLHRLRHSPRHRPHNTLGIPTLSRFALSQNLFREVRLQRRFPIADERCLLC